jgi:O-antigen/teichoic acid export membrane protein
MPAEFPAENRPDSYLERLVSWAERIFKTDLHYLLRGGFWSTAGTVVSSLSALALSLALSRWVPKELYGDYKYALAFVAVLGSFCLNGIGTAVFQSTASGFGRSLTDGAKAFIKWSLIVFIGAFVFGAYYLIHGNEILGIGILVGGSFSPFLGAANLYTSYLSAKKDFRRQSLYGMVGTALPAAALLITAYFYPTPIPLLITYFVANTLITIVLYYRTLKLYRVHDELSDPGMIAYSKHQSIMGVIATFTGNIDDLFLFHVAGGIPVAIYTFAIGVLDQSKGPLKALDSMMQARFATHKTQTIEESMGNKMLWLFITSLVIIIVYVIAAPFIYAILFPAYTASVAYSQVYSLSFLSLFAGPAGSYINVKKKLKEQYINAVVNSGIQIGAIVIGILFWGLWGLIWARVVIRIGGGLVTYVLYRGAVKRATL